MIKNVLIVALAGFGVYYYALSKGVDLGVTLKPLYDYAVHFTQ